MLLSAASQSSRKRVRDKGPKGLGKGKPPKSVPKLEGHIITSTRPDSDSRPFWPDGFGGDPPTLSDWIEQSHVGS